MSVRKRGGSYQVTYRCPGESSPRTETFKSEEEAYIRDMQIKLAKKSGKFEPPRRIAKGETEQIRNVTVRKLLEEYVEIYGLKKWGNSYYSANLSLIKNYINPYIGGEFYESRSCRIYNEFNQFL